MKSRTAKTALISLSFTAAFTLATPASQAADEPPAHEPVRAEAAENAASAAPAALTSTPPTPSSLERLTHAASSAAAATVSVAASAAAATVSVATGAAVATVTAANTAASAATSAASAALNLASDAATSAVNAAVQAAGTLFQSGRISYYADKFHGRPTASGEPYDSQGLTMAHRTLPLGTKVLITNTANQRSVVVTVNDRGPFAGSRVADLSRAAAEKLNMVRTGLADATLHVLPAALLPKPDKNDKAGKASP